jgi:hypothetical protein
MPVEVTPLNGCGPNLSIRSRPHRMTIKNFPLHSVLESVTVRLYSLLTVLEVRQAGSGC